MLGLCDAEVGHADLVPGSDPITMVVRLSGGKHAKVELLMLVFENSERKHPTFGTPR